ncbi:MAG: hypothetical protein M1828_004811 [Chrysothrix sp. TS-e1954]|nr:MAG: hypothetical protein M1828_004811 [Chrysothrix sp. TS-e1954]
MPRTPSPPTDMYQVYRVRHTVALIDPDVPQPRYHHSVFVVTSPETGSGYIHNVVGDITSANGVSYQMKPSEDPRDSRSFHDMALIGYVARANYPDSFGSLLSGLPTPPKQKSFNPKTMKTEPIKSDGCFYAPGEPRRPLVKCTEWTEQDAIPALHSSGMLLQRSQTGSPRRTGPSGIAPQHNSPGKS